MAADNQPVQAPFDALPELSAIELSSNFHRFVYYLWPVVYLIDCITYIISMQSSKDSVLSMLVVSVAIFNLTWALTISPILAAIGIYYIYYKKIKFSHPEVSYVRDMKLIQLIMKMTSDQTEAATQFVENVIFWKEPE